MNSTGLECKNFKGNLYPKTLEYAIVKFYAWAGILFIFNFLPLKDPGSIRCEIFVMKRSGIFHSKWHFICTKNFPVIYKNSSPLLFPFALKIMKFSHLESLQYKVITLSCKLLYLSTSRFYSVHSIGWQRSPCHWVHPERLAPTVLNKLFYYLSLTWIAT